MDENTKVIEKPEILEARPKVKDRRRPGRVEYANPDLIAMLRSAPYADESDAVADHDNPLSAARGIATGALLAVPLWGLIGLAVWLVRFGFAR